MTRGGFAWREAALALGLLGLVGNFAVSRRLTRQVTREERSAETSLAELARAEAAYQKLSGAWCGDLTKIPGIPRALQQGRVDGYRYGTLPLDGHGIPLKPDRRYAYYAVPEAYAVTGHRTYLLDPEGRIYTKDRGTNDPPAAWPGSDPCASGWTVLGQ